MCANGANRKLGSTGCMNTTWRREETAVTERARDGQRRETKRRQGRYCTEAVLSRKMRRARTGQSKGQTSRPAAKSDSDITKKERGMEQGATHAWQQMYGQMTDRRHPGRKKNNGRAPEARQEGWPQRREPS